MQFIDTHCHIHSLDYPLDREVVYDRALKAGVSKMICVGTDETDSKLAVGFALKHKNAWAAVGIHPHEAKKGVEDLKLIAHGKKVIAIGEIGLDYFYQHSTRQQQIMALEIQIQLAVDMNLPIIFHVREAFEDFWPVLANFNSSHKKIRGVLHSFSDSIKNAEKTLESNLLLGINGIATFTKSDTQKNMYKTLGLDRIILETDAPYLTPTPFRGKVNEPMYVRNVAEYLSQVKSLPIDEISATTTHNATKLFEI